MTVGFYCLKRLFFGVPTLLGILFFNFFLLRLLPGTSTDYLNVKASGENLNSGALIVGEGLDTTGLRGTSMIPLSSSDSNSFLWEDFKEFLYHYGQFDFGQSHTKGCSVATLIADHLWVSLILGLGALAVSYGVAFFLARFKARNSGAFLDRCTTGFLVLFDAFPPFLMAFLLFLFLAGKIFPLGGLKSDLWESLSFGSKVTDILYHLALPIISLVLGGLASTTFFIKTIFMEELPQPYVQSIYARGGTEKQAFSHMSFHVLLGLLSQFPSTFMGLFLVNTLVVEMVFSLEGMGLLIWQSVVERDYPVLMGTFFIMSCVGMIMQLVADLLFAFLDPRIHFKKDGIS